MSDVLQGLFVQPIPITGFGRLGMLIPLTLAISIVCKTIRCERLSAIPLASASLCVVILFFMGLIAAALLAVFHLLA